MTWSNSDGLFVKFGVEESVVSRGGEYKTYGQNRVTEFLLDWEDLTASAQILGAGSSVDAGSNGILMPSNAYIEAIETITEEAFTVSGGSVDTADIQIGLIRQDRSTTYDVDGFTAVTFVGTAWKTAGMRTFLVNGSTGVGAFQGTSLANSGYVVALSSRIATDILSAGRMRVRIHWHVVVDNVDGS
jgi:hypothetical protein